MAVIKVIIPAVNEGDSIAKVGFGAAKIRFPKL